MNLLLCIVYENFLGVDHEITDLIFPDYVIYIIYMTLIDLQSYLKS